MFTTKHRPPFVIAREIDGRQGFCDLAFTYWKYEPWDVKMLGKVVKHRWHLFRLHGELRRAIRDQSLAATKDEW